MNGEKSENKIEQIGDHIKRVNYNQCKSLKLKTKTSNPSQLTTQSFPKIHTKMDQIHDYNADEYPSNNDYNDNDDYGNYGDEYNDYGGDYDYDNQYIEEGQIHDYNDTAKQYDVLPYNALFDEVLQQLKTAQEMTALDQGWCLLLLREFKWDVEKLSDYFQDMDKYRKKIGYSEKYPNPNQLITFVNTCDVCCSQNTQLYANICQDGYCAQCWKNHLETSIKTANPFMKCMGCDCPLLNQTVLMMLQKLYPHERKLIQAYEKEISEQFSTIHRSYKFCTGVDCGNCIKVYNLNLKSVKCTCGKVFCPKCNSDDHSPCTCDQKRQWLENVMKEQADAKWMAVNTKLCPWCKKAVERSAGCNYMACVCGKSFCYLCSRPWEPDHKDHFKCHIYKKSSTEQVNREKQILEKMNFYTERFLNSQATAIENKKIKTFDLRKLLFETLKIDLSDSQFIQSAYNFSIECCECLKWIYAYSYYVKWKNTTEEEVFKFDQGEFERFKDNLLKLLAIDLKKFIKQVELYKAENHHNPAIEQKSIEQFKQLKKTIVNYYTMAKKYKEKFLEGLQNKAEEGLMKKKSSTGPGLERKKTQQKKQVPPTKRVTRSTAKTEKPQQKPGKLAGWFGKHIS